MPDAPSPSPSPSPSQDLLEVRGLSKSFGGLAAIDNVDLLVRQGGIHAVIGPNGAGKTSLFNCITAFVRPSAGTIRLAGHRIDGLAAHLVARQGVARTYQNVRLFPNMTGLENVLVGQHRLLRRPFFEAVLGTRSFRHEEAEARERAHRLLAFVGIERHASDLARHLAYGVQRRLEIARAIVSSPRLLMLDEPAAGMNPAEGAELAELISRIRTELGITIVLIEHHMHVVMAVAERITVFDRGRVLAEGGPEAIQADERVIAAYLGQRGRAPERRRSARPAPEARPEPSIASLSGAALA